MGRYLLVVGLLPLQLTAMDNFRRSLSLKIIKQRNSAPPVLARVKEESPLTGIQRISEILKKFPNDETHAQRIYRLASELEQVRLTIHWEPLLMALVSLKAYVHLEFALAHQVNPNMQSNSGDTALHEAARRDDLRAIQLLLAHGADEEIENLAGVTPKSILYESSSSDIILLLNEHRKIHLKSPPSSAAASPRTVDAAYEASDEFTHEDLQALKQLNLPKACVCLCQACQTCLFKEPEKS